MFAVGFLYFHIFSNTPNLPGIVIMNWFWIFIKSASTEVISPPTLIYSCSEFHC